MRLSIRSQFSFGTSEAVRALLQFEAAATQSQRVEHAKTSFSPDLEFTRTKAQDDIGQRMLLEVDGELEVEYESQVTINRQDAALSGLETPDLNDLPAVAVPYLLDTRYCQSEKFTSFANSEFSGNSGGERISAIRDWIAQHFIYSPGASTSETTALDSFAQRNGVCRDYAHVLISLARASGIPARYVACYAPQVDPPDFHAVAQVFLSDPDTGEARWHLIDATGMSDPPSTAIIGVGRDAGDVSFLTTFGTSDFYRSSVHVEVNE